MFYWLNSLGYSLIKFHPNWIGNLSLPQVYGLLGGFNSLETKKAEALKKENPPGISERPTRTGVSRRTSVGSIHQLKMMPGVRKIKRRK